MKHLHFNLYTLSAAVLVLGFIASFIWGTQARVVYVFGVASGVVFLAGAIVQVVGVVKKRRGR